LSGGALSALVEAILRMRLFDESYYAELYCCIPNIPGQFMRLAMALAGMELEPRARCGDPCLPILSFSFLKHYVDGPGPSKFTFEGLAHLTELEPPSLSALTSRVYVNASREYERQPHGADPHSVETVTHKLAIALAKHLISPCSPLKEPHTPPLEELWCPGMNQCPVAAFAHHEEIARLESQILPRVHIPPETCYATACHVTLPTVADALVDYSRAQGMPHVLPPLAEVTIDVATNEDRPGLLAGVLAELNFRHATAPTYRSTPLIPSPWLWNNRYFRAYVCHNRLFAICEMIGNIRLRSGAPRERVDPVMPHLIRSVHITPARDGGAWGRYLLALVNFFGADRCEAHLKERTWVLTTW
jgi:hypothetical protein